MSLNILRKTKTYVLRQGKITACQKRALEELMSYYGLNYQLEQLDLNQIFGRNNPKIIEIGFGMGYATSEIAKNHPECDYLGLEVHTPGVGSLLNEIHHLNLTNLKLIKHDAIEVLKNMIVDNSISGFHIFFPDPWHKKRHHKRRLIQTALVNTLVNKLVTNGYIHLATDWEEYAVFMLAVLKENPFLINQSETNGFVVKPDYRPQTKFEARGIKLGHRVYDLIFRKAN